MSNFTVPRGLDFDFRINVIEQDSFLPQDLTNMDTATFKIMSKDTQTLVSWVDINGATQDAINLAVPGSTTPVITVPHEAAIPATNSVDSIKVAVVDKVKYVLTLGNVEYYKDFTGDVVTPTVAEILDGLVGVISNLPVGITVSVNTDTNGDTDEIVVTTSGVGTTAVSSNLVLTNSVLGTAAVPEVLEESYVPKGQNAKNGMLVGKLTSELTAELNAEPKGGVADNYYQIPKYSGVINITFTDATIDSITTVINDIYVTPTGS